MRELVNYSIETDQTVLLSFRGGRHVRVPMGQLSQYLLPADLERVRSAIKLRHDFLRQHMPKAAIALAVGGMLALLATSGRAMAHLWIGNQPLPSVEQPAVPHNDIARSSNSPQPSVASDTTAATAAHTAKTPPLVALSHRSSEVHTAAVVKPATPRRISVNLPLLPPITLPFVTTPAPTPSPSVTPTPTPTASLPPVASDTTPSGDTVGPTLPDTTTPPAGQVLGDSTQQQPEF